MIQIKLRSTDSNRRMFDHEGKETKCNRDCWNSGFFSGQRANRAKRVDLGRSIATMLFVQLVQLEEQRYGRRVVER